MVNTQGVHLFNICLFVVVFFIYLFFLQFFVYFLSQCSRSLVLKEKKQGHVLVWCFWCYFFCKFIKLVKMCTYAYVEKKVEQIT